MQKIKFELKKTFKLLRVFSVFLIFAFLLLTTGNVEAADFKTDYQVEYNLSQFKENLSSKARFNIRITNLKGDVYVNKFTIGFPKSFAISNVISSDDNGPISPNIINDDINTKIEMEFTNPNVGRDSINNFYLDFDQLNLFKVNGNVWEVALPVIENKDGGEYKVIVKLPANSDKKISISKPRPSQITGNQIVWDNPQTKTIYAVFGENQFYNTELSFHLKNDEVFPVITEIVFPPDGLFQKIYIDSISPSPRSVYQDEDGNYLGKYLLSPFESKTIIFRGLIEVFAKPREEMVPVIKNRLINQKKYLLSGQKFWQIDSLEKLDGLNTVEDIYNFTANKLSYNYKKINSDNIRLGAEKALSSPDQAVCLEFTDLFVGIAREKGIMAREIEGYGFSYDPQLQPLSLVSDVLHAWPEYYNEQNGLWIPVDPTWENTSGIDYFSSFDLNHIVFAIHGKKSDYPYPAGMYKIGDSKDISIKATTDIPVEKNEISVENFSLPQRISDKRTYTGKFTVVNKSNVYLIDIPVRIEGSNLTFDKENYEIEILAPLEKKEIVFNYKVSEKNKLIKNNQGQVSIHIFNNKIIEQKTVIFPLIYIVLFYSAASLVTIFIIYIFGRKIIKKINDRKKIN